MSREKFVSFFEAQLERTLIEARQALSELATSRQITGSGALLISIIDRYKCGIIIENGESGFELDQARKTISFRASMMSAVWNELFDLGSEIGLSEIEVRRLQENGINQLIIHELVHVTQMLWDFSAVPAVKAGLPHLGLPILDLAADIEAALISAQIECINQGDSKPDSFLAQFANALLRAYMIGAFVYDARTNPAKRQRAIGLIISLVLVQSQIGGRLGSEDLNPNWKPSSPVLAFDMHSSHRFNAFLLGEQTGLLLHHKDVPDGEQLDELWECVGRHPIERIIELVSMFLKAAKAIV